MENTKVHAKDTFAKRYTEDNSGEYSWREPHPPQHNGDSDMKIASPFHRCGFCGSMHPTELVTAIKAGATISWSDRKYGWPHKVYVSGAPNQYAGLMEIRSSGPDGPGPELPAKTTEHGKFYTLHLQDANTEELEIIQRSMGIKFRWLADGNVQWIGFNNEWPIEEEK